MVPFRVFRLFGFGIGVSTIKEALLMIIYIVSAIGALSLRIPVDIATTFKEGPRPRVYAQIHFTVEPIIEPWFSVIGSNTS
jgi:hypothetical protein